MLIPIFIDTSAIAEQFSGIDQEQIEAVCDNIAKGLAARYAIILTEEANKSLHQTRGRYTKAITVIDTGKLEGTVMLDYSKDPMVKMIEEGIAAFDMKEKMLASAKVKIGKNGGRYLTIPFRMATPGAVADSDAFTSTMPQEVYDVVKNKPTNIATGSGTRSAGLMVKELPSQYQTPKVRTEIKDSDGKVLFKAYQNQSSIYAGLIKTNDAATGQNTYNTFRRVSSNSDPLAFIHPGIERHNLIGKALVNFNVEREIEIQLGNELIKLGLS
jgi:hypothetical protein